MYNKFFGFNDLPFINQPDSKFFFMSPPHQRILHFLMYSILKKKELITIIGEAGHGKTAFFHYLKTMENEIDDTIKMAFIQGPKIDLKSIIKQALEELIISEVIPFPVNSGSLQQNLSPQIHSKISIVLVIDEAQNLTEHQWDQIQLILNRKRDESKLFHLALLGRPDLEDNLHQSLAQQLNHQTYVTYQMNALGESETFHYIEYRLQMAGRNWKNIFSYQALRDIYRESQGIPFYINDICDKALFVGFSRQQQFIDQKIIQELSSIFENSDDNFNRLSINQKNLPRPTSLQQPKKLNNHLVTSSEGYKKGYKILGSKEEIFPSSEKSLIIDKRVQKKIKLKNRLGENFARKKTSWDTKKNKTKIKEASPKIKKTYMKEVPNLKNQYKKKPSCRNLPSVNYIKQFELINTHPQIDKERNWLKKYLTSLGKNMIKNNKEIHIPAKIKEEYQKIKRNLFLNNSSLEMQAFMFASSNRGEGTSTVVTNFAITLASTEEAQVLLVDANLRTPKLHTFFNISKETGLAEIIQAKGPWTDMVHSSRIPNLSVITAGETVLNPLLLFESPLLEKIIREFRQHFDYILFDMCAVNSYPDPILLAPQADGLVLVVQADKTRKELIQQAKKTLDGVMNILGVILNRKNYYIPDSIYQKL